MVKKLKINCGTLDTRNLVEETLAAYESVAVNCGTLIVTPESQALLSRYGVAANCGDTLSLPKDVVLRRSTAPTRSRPAMPSPPAATCR